MYKIIQRRKLWYLISGILIIPGIIALFTWGLRIGIDFAGGNLLEVQIKSKKVSFDQIQATLSDLKLENLTGQTSGKDVIIFRYRKPKNLKIKEDQLADQIIKTLSESKEIGVSEKIRFESVGPTVSRTLTKKAITAVIIASILIIFYIAWAFRGVSHSAASSWRMGAIAVIALVHDILFVIGLFSILGHFFPIFEVNALFITALLTILGYSINDTIIVFDRIRENLRRLPGKDLESIANTAINQTLVRSLNTSLGLIFVLLALLLLGGSSIQSFVLALLFGTLAGTYSSIFTASPLLITFQQKKHSPNKMADRGVS